MTEGVKLHNFSDTEASDSEETAVATAVYLYLTDRTKTLVSFKARVHPNLCQACAVSVQSIQLRSPTEQPIVL